MEEGAEKSHRMLTSCFLLLSWGKSRFASRESIGEKKISENVTKSDDGNKILGLLKWKA